MKLLVLFFLYILGLVCLPTSIVNSICYQKESIYHGLQNSILCFCLTASVVLLWVTIQHRKHKRILYNGFYIAQLIVILLLLLGCYLTPSMSQIILHINNLFIKITLLIIEFLILYLCNIPEKISKISIYHLKGAFYIACVILVLEGLVLWFFNKNPQLQHDFNFVQNISHVGIAICLLNFSLNIFKSELATEHENDQHGHALTNQIVTMRTQKEATQDHLL
jgi:hypothetical protein